MINEGFDIKVKPDQTMKGVMLDTLAKEYMWDWFLKELGLPCSRSEIFEEISRKLYENN